MEVLIMVEDLYRAQMEIPDEPFEEITIRKGLDGRKRPEKKEKREFITIKKDYGVLKKVILLSITIDIIFWFLWLN